MPHVHPHGIVRREFLQVGFSGFLGMSLPGLLARRASGEAARSAVDGVRPIKSMILVFLTGGLSHVDTLDMKPDQPDQIRGEFKGIATRTPGLNICELMPGLAARSDKYTVLRSLSHQHTNHLNATHQILTGQPQPGAFFDKIASRDDYPCYAAGLGFAKPRTDAVPSGVMLPTFLMQGPLTWPGQHAGFLGPKYDPWHIKDDPNRRAFKVEELSFPEGFSVERIDGRRGLFDELAARRDALGSTSAEAASTDPYLAQRDLAYSLLLSGGVARAFEIHRADPKTRDRYGRHMYGQSLLLARRLVGAGVPIVQVNMGRVQTWDQHSGLFNTYRGRLMAPLDQGVSALLDDLSATGELDETLVIVSGEFGRTPKLGQSTGNNDNTPDGRDHWSRCFSAILAGGGVRGGQIVGASDKIGAYPATRPYTPADLGSTIYAAFGVPRETEVVDRLDRPVRISTGEPILPLYHGRETA
ncbi:MAG: DUF1501 domain-containing protein [Isosphaeraceae bacterium]|nr:DUF1501 domain-containing protein [Isosphaeraceae bacterium]